MRLPIPRNLEKEQRIFSLSYFQLFAIVIFFLIGSEVLIFLGISRGWAFLLSIGAYLFLSFINQNFGPHALAHLFRFVVLPDRLEKDVQFSDRLNDQPGKPVKERCR